VKNKEIDLAHRPIILYCLLALYYLYYYNVAVLNLNSPSHPSFRRSTSEAIVAVDLLHKSTIYRSSGVARNNPTAAMCWIRLFPCAPNQSALMRA
jgi:hypothetical protein